MFLGLTKGLNAGCVFFWKFLEYFDFFPGMEGEEGDEGVPMDLKVFFSVMGVGGAGL